MTVEWTRLARLGKTRRAQKNPKLGELLFNLVRVQTLHSRGAYIYLAVLIQPAFLLLNLPAIDTWSSRV